MSFITRIFGLFSGPGITRQTGPQTTSPAVYSTSAAAPVTFDSAMTISAFWACARLLSETIASMPLKCYRIDGEAVEIDTRNKLWRLLNFQPNRYQTRTEFFETIGLNLATTGNSYCSVERDQSGAPISIIPLMSAQMQPELLDDGTVIYTYLAGDGSTRVYAASSIWHIKLFGNGVVGLSPLGYMRNTIGIALATDKRVTTLAASGGKSNGVLMVDKVLTPDQRAAVRRNFAGLTEGGVDQLFVLEADMKFERTSLSPQDMQLLETRRFQIEDICRFMGVPSVLVNDTSATTAWGSGIQQIVEGWYKLGLRPYLERIESSIKRHLMNPRDWEKYDFEFDFDALLRADQATRYDGYGKAINSGQLTPNEARAKEGRAPKKGGDDIYLNGTLVPAGQPKQVAAPQAPLMNEEGGDDVSEDPADQ